jgi:hypothetical protein
MRGQIVDAISIWERPTQIEENLCSSGTQTHFTTKAAGFILLTDPFLL